MWTSSIRTSITKHHISYFTKTRQITTTTTTTSIPGCTCQYTNTIYRYENRATFTTTSTTPTPTTTSPSTTPSTATTTTTPSRPSYPTPASLHARIHEQQYTYDAIIPLLEKRGLIHQVSMILCIVCLCVCCV